MKLALGGQLKENPALPGFFTSAFRHLPRTEASQLSAQEAVDAISFS